MSFLLAGSDLYSFAKYNCNNKYSVFLSSKTCYSKLSKLRASMRPPHSGSYLEVRVAMGSPELAVDYRSLEDYALNLKFGPHLGPLCWLSSA